MKAPITLKTLSLATAQEVFDQVATHLMMQGRKSGRPHNSPYYQGKFACLYRDSDGGKCAAGFLIGDDEYMAGMEGGKWFGLIQAGLAPNVHCDLISQLQDVHDHQQVENWLSALHLLARSQRLSPAALEGFNPLARDPRSEPALPSPHAYPKIAVIPQGGWKWEMPSEKVEAPVLKTVKVLSWPDLELCTAIDMFKPKAAVKKVTEEAFETTS